MAGPRVRPDLYVVARFLDALWTPPEGFPPEMTRARLQAATRLNYDIFRSYLEKMLAKGLVVERAGKDGKTVVKLTQAGREAHERIVAWVRSFIEGDL